MVIIIKTKLHIKLAENRMTQRELSEKTGIRQPTISAYCNDTYKMIAKGHIDKICKILNCKVEDIFEYICD